MSSNPNRDKREWGDVEKYTDPKGNRSGQIISEGERIKNIYTLQGGRRGFQDSTGNTWYETEPESGEFRIQAGQGRNGGAGYQSPITIAFGGIKREEPKSEGGGGGLLAEEPGSVVGAQGGGVLNQGPTASDVVGGYNQMFAFEPMTAATHINPLVEPSSWMYQGQGYTPASPGQYVVPNLMTTLV
jgi:hypothetical protein